MLKIKHFTKSYKGGTKAVDDLSLTVEDGDICLLYTSPCKRAAVFPQLPRLVVNGQQISAREKLRRDRISFDI